MIVKSKPKTIKNNIKNIIAKVVGIVTENGIKNKKLNIILNTS